MPITEAQIEAARAEFRRRWPEVSPSIEDTYARFEQLVQEAGDGSLR